MRNVNRPAGRHSVYITCQLYLPCGGGWGKQIYTYACAVAHILKV